MTLATNQTGQQNLRAASSAGRVMGLRKQSVSEIITYAVDYSGWLASGEILSSSAYAITSSAPQQLIMSSLQFQPGYTGLIFQLSGGTSGYKYKVELSVTTSSGQKKVDTFWVTVLAPVGQTSTTTPILEVGDVYMSQLKKALAAGYSPVSIPANSVNTIQLLISDDPNDPGNQQWFGGIFVGSGDAVWTTIKNNFSLTTQQADQFLAFAGSFTP